MVKFGGVRNYIVGTWSQEDLDACADLNLPCADVTAYLAEPMDNASNAGSLSTHDYNVSRRHHCCRLVLPCLVMVCLCRPLCGTCTGAAACLPGVDGLYSLLFWGAAGGVLGKARHPPPPSSPRVRRVF